jgi:hypothetical protein
VLLQLVETFGASFPLVGRETTAEQLLKSTALRYAAFKDGKRDNKLHPIPICVGGPGTGKSRVNQEGLELMTQLAEQKGHPLLPLLKSASSICVSYSNGMMAGHVDRTFGGEVGLALRLLYREFAEQEALEFTKWVSLFDVQPTSLTLNVAIEALRLTLDIEADSVGLLYIGVDEFNSLANFGTPLLESVLSCVGEAMSSRHNCFVVGMLTGTASQALVDAHDSSRNGYERLTAPLLGLSDAEQVVQTIGSLQDIEWKKQAAFRRCMAGQRNSQMLVFVVGRLF